MDLLGSGYSSKPSPTSAEARAISGENGRNLTPSVSRLGTAWGGSREGVEVVLQHPLGSVYNFYTWAEQVQMLRKHRLHRPFPRVPAPRNPIRVAANPRKSNRQETRDASAPFTRFHRVVDRGFKYLKSPASKLISAL